MGGASSTGNSTTSGSGSTGSSSSSRNGSASGTTTGSNRTSSDNGNHTEAAGRARSDGVNLSGDVNEPEQDSGVNLAGLTGADTKTVTVGKWGTGNNDCVINALRGAGFTDREIREQGLVDQVARMNNLKDPNLVHPGQQLTLPGRDAAAAQTQPGLDPVANPEVGIPDFGPNPSRAQVSQMLEAAAQKYGIPVDTLKAVAWQESSWRADASSFDGGHGKGIMQIDDRYHDFANTSQVWDPVANIDYGARYLSDLHGQYGSWNEALHHYNGGSTYAGTVNALAARQPWTAFV